jgi:hypothetical protein
MITAQAARPRTTARAADDQRAARRTDPRQAGPDRMTTARAGWPRPDERRAGARMTTARAGGTTARAGGE